MTDEEMLHRMARVYSALGATVEEDPERVKASIVVKHFDDERGAGFGFDANAGWTRAQLENHVFTLLHNIAQLNDHARRWLKARGSDKNLVDQLLDVNLVLRHLLDMSNKDKHGGTKRPDELHSGTQPAIRLLRRVLVLTTDAAPNSSASISLGPDGQPNIQGKASFAVYAIVFDGNGKALGNLNNMMREAIEIWEKFLADQGLDLGPAR